MPITNKTRSKSPESHTTETTHEETATVAPPTAEIAGLEIIASKKKETKASTTEKSADIKREVLETEVVGADRETAEKIASLELSKTTSEQLDKWRRFEIVNHTLLAKLFDNGFTREELEELQNFRKIELPANLELNGPEKIALNKLKEIAAQTNSPLFLDFKKKWPKIIDDIHKTYTHSAQTRDALFGTASDKKEAQKNNNLISFIKKHPIATATVMIAGAYGIYRVFFADNTKEDSHKETGTKSSWYEKIKSKPGSILLGLLVLGGLIGPHRIGMWLDKGFDFTKEKIERFIQLLSEGKYKEAIISLFEGNDEKMENYSKIAKIISQETNTVVTDTGIKAIANARYSVFISVLGKTKSFASTWVEEIPGLGSTLASFILDTKEQAAQENAIRQYLAKHKDKINKLGIDNNATVYEVLAKLNELTTNTVTESNEKQSQGPITEIVEAGTGKVDEVVAICDQTLEQLKKEFKDCPHFQALLAKYEQDKWKILSIQFADDLITAIRADGKGLAIVGGAIIVWNGYKYITLTSVETIAKSVYEILKAPFNHDTDWTKSIIEYTKGSSVFIVAGAGMGGIVAAWQKQNVLHGILSGAGKGFAYPVTVVKTHLRAGQWIYRTARGMEFAIRKRHAAPEVRPKIMEAEARYYAEIFDKYDTLERLGDQAGFYDPRKWYAKLSQKRIQELKLKYLQKFASVFGKKEFPGGKQLPTKSANDITNAENKLRDWLQEQRSLEQNQNALKEPTTAIATDNNKPVHVKTEGQGLDTRHTYKYHGTEIVLTEKEIAEKAREIAQKETATGNVPKTPEQIQVWNNNNWQKAIDSLAEDKILTPVEIAGKPDTYSFAGQEVTITDAELKPKLATGLTKDEALKAACMEKILAHATVEEVRIVNGEHEYKINGQWIKTELPNKPAKIAEVKEAFIKYAKEKGTSLNFDKFAAEAKTLKFLPILEKIIGLSAAIGMIYYLETATDKRKAVAETAAGFGTFWAGMQLTDWQIASKIIQTPKTPLQMAARTVIDIMGGIAAAYGLTEPVSNIVTSVFAMVPGSYGISKEVSEIFEKMALRSTMRIVFASAENGALKKVIMKMGLESISLAFEKKIGGILLEKIGQLAAKKGFKQILKALGWKGATTAALLADDATLIGVIDDIIAVGMIIWMGFDIYEIIKLIANAAEIKQEMDKRSAAKITSFEIKDSASRKAFAAKLSPLGLSVEQTQELGEKAVFDILQSLPQTEIAIRRENMNGMEIWSLKNGTATGIAILDEMGRVKCQISGEDTETIEKALANMTVKETS